MPEGAERFTGGFPEAKVHSEPIRRKRRWPDQEEQTFLLCGLGGDQARMLASATKTVINPAAIFDAGATPTWQPQYPPAQLQCDGGGGMRFRSNTAVLPHGAPLSRATSFQPPDGSAAKIMLANQHGGLSEQRWRDRSQTTIFPPAPPSSTVTPLTRRSTMCERADYDIRRYSISPTNLFDPPVLGKAVGRATGGGQVGTAPSESRTWGWAAPTSYLHMLIDVNGGLPRQRLGATYAPDLDLGQLESRAAHSRHQRRFLFDARNAGLHFTQGGWNGIGNVDTGNPFLFRINQYVANINMSWTKGRHGCGMAWSIPAAG